MRYATHALIAIICMFFAAASAHGADGDNEIFYQCMANSAVNGTDVSAQFCQCADKRAAEVLNPSDLARARADYRFLNTLGAVTAKPNTYERRASLVFDDCRRCAEKNFIDCLPAEGGGLIIPYEAIAANLVDAQFDLIERDVIFEEFAIDLVNVYGDACTTNVRNPMQIWVETINGEGELVDSTDPLTLDRRIHPRYKEYTSNRARRVTQQNLQDIADARRNNSLPTFAVSEVARLVQSRLALAGLLGSDCSAGSPLDRAYRNFFAMELGDARVAPAREPRRIKSGVRDPGRLEALIAKLKAARDARLAKSAHNLPLSCDWTAAEVNGGTLPVPVPGEHNAYKAHYEAYAGGYRLAMGDEVLRLALYPIKGQERRQDWERGLTGYGVMEGTGCLVTADIIQNGDFQASLALSKVQNTRAEQEACAATTAMRGYKVYFYMGFERPGAAVPVYPRKAYWERGSDKSCTDLDMALQPAPLPQSAVAALKAYEDAHLSPQAIRVERRAPPGFWERVGE